jgi:hypothetical protein
LRSIAAFRTASRAGGKALLSDCWILLLLRRIACPALIAAMHTLDEFSQFPNWAKLGCEAQGLILPLQAGHSDHGADCRS